MLRIKKIWIFPVSPDTNYNFWNSFSMLQLPHHTQELVGFKMNRMMIPRPETEDQLKLRFQVELEFVQCLANPNYLNFLAQREYFKDTAFVNYLRYLQYWKEPEYARFLKYPMCLHFLDLLQYSEFRKELANSKCTKFVEEQQLLHWQHYIRKRSKLLPSGAPGQNIATTAVDASNSSIAATSHNTASTNSSISNSRQ